MRKIALAIHGGAGTILKSLMTPELEKEYRGGLHSALEIGYRLLASGGASLDAVHAAVCSLEDFYLFNAGRGSVFTHDGTNEMDASIMDGQRLRAGAVASVRNVKNPIGLARLVMERTPHILLCDRGASDFARQMQVEFADDAYFYTQHRYDQYKRALDAGEVLLDHSLPQHQVFAQVSESSSKNNSQSPRSSDQAETQSNEFAGDRNPPKPLGTVGAVACDAGGNLAAATSTGGMTNKQFGRVGDTPLIGAGTYADNATCGVSCTGHGEFFMLGVTAYDVAARMKYGDASLTKAAHEAIDRLTEIGGEGGLIAVDSSGNIAMPFNSEGMYRGSVSDDGEVRISIYR